MTEEGGGAGGGEAGPAPLPLIEPHIEPVHAGIEANDVYNMLLGAQGVLSFHNARVSRIQRGDIGEHIFAMIAPAIFNVSWAQVSIVGAHEVLGQGDGGQDIRIEAPGTTIIVDFKAWAPNGPAVHAKDARSIGGALAAISTNKPTRLGIVATNHGFTGAARRYATDYENNNVGTGLRVELWDNAKLRTQMSRAIQACPGGPGGFISDVLCYLDFKRLIDYPTARSRAASLAQRAHVDSLRNLFH